MKDYAIIVDRVRFKQIFMNLLSNAVKFTNSGGKVEFLTQNIVVENNMVSCDYVVRDNGIGMSEEFQKKMYEPFLQETKDEVYQSQGTGLGLSIVKSLVQLMGGTIRVKSKENVGTEFTIRLKLPIAEKPKEIKRDENIDLTVIKGKMVLIAEDHPLNVIIVKKLLHNYGVNTLVAENGQKAIELFAASKEFSIDAILMDINMPLLNGYEATKKIRQMNRADAKIIPIIAMSANAFEEDKKLSIIAGMNDHLTKPIDSVTLYSELAKHILKK